MLPSNPNKPKINPRQMVKEKQEDELYSLICSTGYIPDEGNFSDFCQSLLSGFALLGCGEPGAGKTVFSDALYEACNLDYYTVSGRDELRQEELLCAWDKDEQESFMREVHAIVQSQSETERAGALESARQQRWTKRFLILGEVAAAYSKAQESEFPTLLRLDEADKFGASVEDALLSPLATGKIYVERLAEGFVGCTNPEFLPIVISTSNDSRHELSLPFRDRHLHTFFATPNLTKELEILRARCPEIKAANLSNALKLLDAIRSVAGISHYPSVRTGIQLVTDTAPPVKAAFPPVYLRRDIQKAVVYRKPDVLRFSDMQIFASSFTQVSVARSRTDRHTNSKKSVKGNRVKTQAGMAVSLNNISSQTDVNSVSDKQEPNSGAFAETDAALEEIGLQMMGSDSPNANQENVLALANDTSADKSSEGFMKQKLKTFLKAEKPKVNIGEDEDLQDYFDSEVVLQAKPPIGSDEGAEFKREVTLSRKFALTARTKAVEESKINQKGKMQDEFNTPLALRVL